MSYKEYWKGQIELQLNWRENQKNISKEYGYQNGNKYVHILPKDEWHNTIWDKFKKELLDYLNKENIQHHTGSHNLLSSWVLCSNLYFGAFVNDNLKELFRQFLEYKLEIKIDEIKDIQLEFVLPEKLSPVYLLGEPGGKRGTKQTTPDLAIEYITNGKINLILVECKYTEHGFYDCPAKKDKSNDVCTKKETMKSIKKDCIQIQWGRKYWEYLNISKNGYNMLKCCPAYSGGYQIVRQQALAEGIKKYGNYEDVWSCIAYDGRNESLMKSMHRIGINSIKNEWENLFELKTKFVIWEHQEWAEYVRKNGKEKYENDWVKYINNRYEI